jgi:hypothetical protein
MASIGIARMSFFLLTFNPMTICPPDGTRRGPAMDNYQLENELRHLEQVLNHYVAATQRFPLSYWRGRLNAVLVIALVPSQRTRVRKLDERLRVLEARAADIG